MVKRQPMGTRGSLIMRRLNLDQRLSVAKSLQGGLVLTYYYRYGILTGRHQKRRASETAVGEPEKPW